jgi:hypothetical protein
MNFFYGVSAIKVVTGPINFPRAKKKPLITSSMTAERRIFPKGQAQKLPKHFSKM